MAAWARFQYCLEEPGRQYDDREGKPQVKPGPNGNIPMADDASKNNLQVDCRRCNQCQSARVGLLLCRLDGRGCCRPNAGCHPRQTDEQGEDDLSETAVDQSQIIAHQGIEINAEAAEQSLDDHSQE